MRLTKLLLFLTALTLAHLLYAQANASAMHESLGDLKVIQERGKLRIGILERQAPPFVFIRDGRPAGFEADICRGMAHVLGVESEFITIPGSYNDVVDAVAAGAVDIGVSQLSKTARRSRFVYFSDVYFTTELTLAVNRRSMAQAGLSLEDEHGDNFAAVLRRLKDMPTRLVTMTGTQAEFLLKKLLPAAEIEYSDSWKDAALGVYRDQYDVALMTSASFEIATYNDPKLLYKIAEVKLDVDVPMAMAIWPQRPELMRWVNDYLDANIQIKKLTTGDLIKKYLYDDPGRPAREDDKPDPEASPKPGSVAESMTLVAGLYLVFAVIFWLGVVRRGGTTHWLLSPWAALGGMALGGVTGIQFPELAEYFGRPAGVYMDFWRMCVLPIMITAIVTSVYKLLTGGDNSRLINRLLVFMPLLLLIAVTFGIGFGVLGQPGTDFSEESQNMLVKDLGSGQQKHQAMGLYDVLVQMLDNIVPDNVFVPLVQNQSLAALFIAVFFGICIAGVSSGGKSATIEILEAVFETFTKMIRFSLYLLPFALYGLALEFMAQTGLDLLTAILRLVAFLCLAMIPACLFTFWALRRRLDIPAKTIFRDFGPIFLLSFSARSSVITMPIGLEAMARCRQIDKDQTMAAFPFALLICHYPRAVFYGMIPVFISQAFSIDLGISQYLLIAVLGILATIAAIGSIGTYVFLLAIICTPLGLPVEPAILIGLGVASLLNPLIAAIQAVFGCGLTTLLVKKTHTSKQDGPALQPDCG